MQMINRHKVFISYYHKDDQFYADALRKMECYNPSLGKRQSIFDDYSVREKEIDDEGRPAESIRRIIRDEYIRDATVLIVLCGKHTKERKYVDWEIHASMYNSDINPKMGILVINLPSIKNLQTVRASVEEEKKLVTTNPNTRWVHLETKQEYQNYYPYLPSRIIDNLVKGVAISIVDWDIIANDPERLQKLIDNAYKYRSDNKYDLSRPLRRQNS